LLAQKRPPDEIIVVDSSDYKDTIDLLKREYTASSIVWIRSTPSVCLQRNIGIRAATGNWILLSDDDVEFKDDYLEELENYIRQNSNCGAVAGRLLEYEENTWTDQYQVPDFKHLFWRFIFQLHIWGDIDSVRPHFLERPLVFFIKKFYAWRGNGFSLAGWPLITNWKGPVIQTCVYSLGANLIKKEWLINSPYDELLDSRGIGDNYGVALGFPGRNSICVLASTFAYHHRAEENRVDPQTAYYRRLLALHYFIKRNRRRFSPLTNIFFIWSILGKGILFLSKGNHKMATQTFKAMGLILRGRNPYWIGFVNNQKMYSPE
jgi:glycosyltransferase involved in cell wall biosynthesis